MTSRGRSSGNGLRGARGRDLVVVREELGSCRFALLPAPSPVLPAETQAVPAAPFSFSLLVPKIIRRTSRSPASDVRSAGWPFRWLASCCCSRTRCAAQSPSSSMLRYRAYRDSVMEQKSRLQYGMNSALAAHKTRMNTGESLLSLTPQAQVSRFSSDYANRYLPAASKAAHESEKLFLERLVAR